MTPMITVRFLGSLSVLGLFACGDSLQDSGQLAVDASAGPSVDIIATGANIAGANGIHFGPDGMLYVATVVGSSLIVLDPDSGKEVRRYTLEDGVIGPDDVAFASDGSFYWTSILTGEVAGFDARGEKVIAARLPPGPNPITFSDDDRLFVAQCFLGYGLYELDPNGVEEPRLISDALGPDCGLNGMDWGPDGRLYGPRWFTGEVVSFDVDDNSYRVEATGFAVPASVKFNSKGELHVLDTGTGDILKVEGAGNRIVASLAPGLDNFAFDVNDRLFVSSFVDGFVLRVNADGTQTMLQPAGMAHPGGVTLQGDNVIVADLHAIRGFNPDTGASTFVQRNIVGVGEMGGALNVSADGANLILVSWFDGDVRVWDPVKAQRVAQIADLQAPVAAVRYGDGIAVSEHGRQQVVLVTGEERVTLASGLPAPSGLVVDQGDLYVSDRALGQILKIAENGARLEEPRVVVDELTTPEGFVVTPGGFVVVEADPGRVVEIGTAGDTRMLAEIPPGTQATSALQPPSQVFNGIAAGTDGSLYVTGETNRSLYRIRP